MEVEVAVALVPDAQRQRGRQAAAVEHHPACEGLRQARVRVVAPGSPERPPNRQDALRRRVGAVQRGIGRTRFAEQGRQATDGHDPQHHAERMEQHRGLDRAAQFGQRQTEDAQEPGPGHGWGRGDLES